MARRRLDKARPEVKRRGRTVVRESRELGRRTRRVRSPVSGACGPSEWYGTEHSVETTSSKPSKRRTKPAGARRAAIEKRNALRVEDAGLVVRVLQHLA